MPSGPKKRKAAKKKKEKEANSTPTAYTHSLGDDDSKHQDEKGSDSGGEISSPASQGHHIPHHPFTEGEEDRDGKGSDSGGEISSPASQDHHSRHHPFTEGEEDQDEKGSDSGGEISSPASQDHHSRHHPFTEGEEEEVEKREIEVENVVLIDREVKPVQESIVYTMESHDSSNLDNESRVEKNVDVVEIIPPVVHSVSEVETVPVVDTDKVPLLEEVVQVNDSVSVDNSVTSDLIESMIKENVEKNLPPLIENVEVSPVGMDLGSQVKDNVVVPISDDKVMASSDAKGLATQENDDKLLLSYNPPRIDTSNCAEQVKDFEDPEASDSKPLIASAPRLVQTTSWKSCCGLLEALTGSSR